MLSDVESDMHTEFHSCFFFLMKVRKAWDYEKSVPGALIAITTVSGFFKCRNCFGCSTLGS